MDTLFHLIPFSVIFWGKGLHKADYLGDFERILERGKNTREMVRA